MSERIDPVQAIRLLDAGKARAVDVREPDEYEMGHIPGAVLLPLGQVTAKAAQLLPDPQAGRPGQGRDTGRGPPPAGADGL